MTTTTDTAPDRVVHADRYDLEAWVSAVETNPAIVETDTLLADVHPVASAGFADAYHTLHKGLPRLVDPDDVDPRYRVNVQIIEALMDTAGWAEARMSTVGDPVMAGVAMAAIGGQLLDLYRKLAPVQEAADRAQAALDAYRADGGDDLADEADRASAELDAMLDAMAPVAVVGARAAADEASEFTARVVCAGTGWEVAADELATMDPAARLALVDRLTNERTERIAALVGRLHCEALAEQARNWDTGNGEIAGLTLGNDLTRLLPSELAGLCHPALLPDFLERYENRQLMQTERRIRPRLDRGGIVYVEDSSTSMRGAPSDWARALGITLLRIAVAQHRAFRAIVFSSPGRMQVFDFGDDAATSTLDDRLSYAELLMGGRTDFMGPLGRALEFVTAEHDATGRTHSDVVFATDGHAPVTDLWLDDWHAAKDDLGMRCYGIAIGVEAQSSSITRVSDFVTSIDRFTDGTDLGAVFRNVTRETT